MRLWLAPRPPSVIKICNYKSANYAETAPNSMPAIYDQGNLGSCTANGAAALGEYLTIKEHLPDFVPSRLFIYYESRKRTGTINQDSGSTVGIAVSVMQMEGAANENLWPYDISQYTVQPPAAVYADAIKHTLFGVVQFEPWDAGGLLQSIKTTIANGFPVIFGMSIFAQFRNVSPSDGMISMPSGESIGMHCVVLCGFDDSTSCFVLRNSWGTGWGQNGWGKIPYEYITLGGVYAFDFWSANELSLSRSCQIPSACGKNWDKKISY